MIDMHCHIIPSVDDGSKSLEVTMEMAKKAVSLGYEGIFATSHYIDNSNELDKVEFKGKVKALNDVLSQNGINLKIYEGNEIYYTPNLLELLQNNKVCTLNNTRYFLMEFPMSGFVFDMENSIRNVIRAGYIPVIAHPERYEFVTKDIKKLLPLIEEGALLQINVGSINGFYGRTVKSNVKKLIKYDMVHLIGTDAHDPHKIYDIGEKSLKKLSKLFDKEKLDIILNENPKHILNNEYVSTWDPKLK